MPSTPSAVCTKAPNFVMLVMGPSTTDPGAILFATSAHGSPSACFSPKEMRRSPGFTPRITASTVSPGFTTSPAVRTRFAQDISETRISDHRLQFHERAKIHDARHRPPNPLAYFVLVRNHVPRMRLKLLHAQRNPVLV